jgi:hypothetical protein
MRCLYIFLTVYKPTLQKTHAVLLILQSPTTAKQTDQKEKGDKQLIPLSAAA